MLEYLGYLIIVIILGSIIIGGTKLFGLMLGSEDA